ncbi:MAG: adenine phosphoribosyltransferase [Chloroflexota bacterium]|nr:MAG: adenine phosphoribosyltransferase [Chloroflexota bacterium]
MDTVQLTQLIRDVPDFPQPGILFRDITTVLRDPSAFRYAIDTLAQRFKERDVDLIVGMESRGFIFGAPLAYILGAGFVPVRKKGKLPAETLSVEYALEYGVAELEIHKDAIRPGQKVLIVDDLLATGGTVNATIQLVEALGGKVSAVAFLIELGFLDGRAKIGSQYETLSIIQY